LQKLSAVTKAAFKALNTLAVALRQPAIPPLAETPSHSVGILEQVSGQGSLKVVPPRECLPHRRWHLLDHRVATVLVTLPVADLRIQYPVKQYILLNYFHLH